MRYASLHQTFPEEAKRLHARLEAEYKERYETYKEILISSSRRHPCHPVLAEFPHQRVKQGRDTQPGHGRQPQ